MGPIFSCDIMVSMPQDQTHFVVNIPLPLSVPLLHFAILFHISFPLISQITHIVSLVAPLIGHYHICDALYGSEKA